MAINPHLEAVGAPEEGKKYFALEEANRALPYISRIVEDVCSTYRAAVNIQRRLEQPLPDADEDSELLRDEYGQLVEQLNVYVDELRLVGVELKDYEMGLVDFPGIHNGREILYCWRRGEEEIQAWHELYAGYTGRQDLSKLKEEPADSGKKK